MMGTNTLQFIHNPFADIAILILLPILFDNKLCINVIYYNANTDNHFLNLLFFLFKF